jgi:hypothetical protein
MKEGVVYSGRLAILCGAALGAAILMAWLRQDLKGVRTAKLRVDARLEAELSRQIAARSDCEESDLEALRTRVDRLRIFLGPKGTWEVLVRQFGKSWTAQAGPKSDCEGYSVQTGTLRLLSPTLADWSKTIDVLTASELLPGVGITGFEMRTSGNRERRSVDLVKVDVEIHTRRSENISVKP